MIKMLLRFSVFLLKERGFYWALEINPPIKSDSQMKLSIVLNVPLNTNQPINKDKIDIVHAYNVIHIYILFRSVISSLRHLYANHLM